MTVALSLFPLPRRTLSLEDQHALILKHQAFINLMAIRHRDQGVSLADLRQIGNLALVERASKYDPTLGTSFMTFSYARVLGAMRDAIRKTRHASQRTAALDFAELIPDDLPRPLDSLLSSDERERLYNAMARLRPEHRELLSLRFGIGGPALSQIEVAERLGQERTTVYRATRAALLDLREKMTLT